jgi:hypothetical protein
MNERLTLRLAGPGCPPLPFCFPSQVAHSFLCCFCLLSWLHVRGEESGRRRER